jgi:GNAT superfamily N-acetyltransferase
MLVQTFSIDINLLSEYATIPIAFEVRSIYRLEAIENGLGGLRLVEQPISSPYIKDYDAYEDGPPTAWPRRFDMRNWGIILARQDPIYAPLGGAVIAWNTNGVNMLEGRDDLAVLWDIRVQPGARGQGIGTGLFASAKDWACQHGCTQLKIETQNVNVPACRFYASQGCELGVIHRHAYAGQPHVADETMLIWYLRLA